MPARCAVSVLQKMRWAPAGPTLGAAAQERVFCRAWGLQSAACVLPLALELQGEAIAFTSEGQNYLTLSEGSNPPVYEYRRVSAVSVLSIPGVIGLVGCLSVLGTRVCWRGKSVR